MTYGLIGEHLGHSWSPLLHNLVSGLDYELAEVSRRELGRWLRETPFRGLNVTIPYKKSVIPYLDSLSPDARETGAVNTIIRLEDGSLKGYNTDVYGAAALMRLSKAPIDGRRVLILGRGGAAMAFAKAARDLGAASIRFAVRTPKTADELPLSSPESFKDSEILANATPVGMFPEITCKPLDISYLPKLDVVLDCIYNPLSSSLVLDARSLGITALGGLRMLVAQAVKTQELFTGESFGEDIISRTHAAIGQRLANIVLIGMPYSGKTTVGRLLASSMGREFVDTDTMVEAAAGRSIPEIFAREGEKTFRTREREAVRGLAPRTGLVIASGGGTVLSDDNLKSLRHNGILCLLDRPIDKMQPSSDRPLASDFASIERLALERAGAYRNAADFCIANDSTPEDAAARIQQAIKLHFQS